MPNSLDTLAVNTPKARNIIRAKKVLVLTAPMSVAMPTSITQGGTTGPVAPVTLKELTGFELIGLIKKDDAVGRSRDRETSTVEAVGYDDPVREDVTSETMSCPFVALETRRTVIEKYLNLDLSGIAPHADTGEVSFPHVNVGRIQPARWIFLGQDGIALNREWFGWGFSAGKVSETDDQTLGGTDSAWEWPMTVTSGTDTDLGWGVISYFGGPGWKQRLLDSGFATV